jgi:2-dehydro-3-deoxygluconokinase
VRVVTFGELLLRLSPPGEERLFASGELVSCFGGAEANVAVGLSHLGVRCDYVTRVPANPIGEAAVAALQREGVGTEWIARGSGEGGGGGGGGGGGDRLGIYFVEPGADLRTMRVVYDRAGSAFARIEPRAVDWPRVLAGAAWLHVSGITPALGDGPAAVLSAAIACAHAQDTPVSFDLNYREALWQDRDPRPIIEPLARRAALLIGNGTALQAMLGVAAEGDARATAEGLTRRLAVQRVAITRREILGAREHIWSAVLYDADHGTFSQSRQHRVQVVDRVGGGDSFAAALIARLLARRDAPGEALEFAVAASALKLTIPGDFSRVSVKEVEALLHR